MSATDQAAVPTDEPLRVVVVDDDDDFRLMLRVQLNLQPGVEVIGTAADGREALDVVDALRPDAVAMDLLMPVLDGFAAIGELRERRPEVGVVAYTAVAGRYARERVAELDAELVLKSGDPTPLVEALRRSIDRAHERTADRASS
jgi:DNA-binding NarL/FixJ family response regulator